MLLITLLVYRNNYMKLVLSLLLFFCFCTIKGQDNAALLKEIDALTEQKQWTKAIPLAEQYVQQVLKEAGDNHRTYLEAVYQLAILYSRINDTEKAGTWFDKYLQTSQKIYGIASPDYARALSNAAIFNARHNINKEAVELYLKSLSITEKASADGGIDHAGTLRNLGLAYVKLKEYEKAEAVYKQSAEIRKTKYGEESWEYEEVLYDLAELYNSTRNYTAALPVLEKAGAIIKKLAGPASGDYAFFLNFAGDIYLKLADTKNAEANYVEAIKIFKEKYGTDNADYAVLLADLPVIYSRINKLAEAETLFKEVLALRKKVIGESSPGYLESLNALGDFYIDQKRYSEALPLYEAGALIAKKMYGAEDRDYDYFLFNVAFINDALKEWARADIVYGEVVALRKKLYGENSRQYALALNNLGVLYLGINKYDNAEPLLLQAMQVRKELLGMEHADYWQSVNNLAKLYMKKKEVEKSETLYLQAYNWYEKNKAKYKKEYVLSIHRIAVLYTDIPAKRNDALTWFYKALPLEKEIFGEQDPMYADDLTVVANIYKVSGDYARAEAQYEQAVSITLNKPNEKPGYLAKAMDIMGRFYKEYGIYNRADSFFKSATAYTRTAFTENSIQYAKALISEAGLYIASGEFALAEPLLLQAEMIINKISGKNNLEYFMSLLNLALVYQKLSQWEKSFEIARQALQMGSSFGLTDYDLFLQVIVPYSMYLKQYADIETMYFDAIKALQDRGEQNNERFIKLQNDLTEVYFKSGQYNKAETLIPTIYQQAEKILKPGHHEYARIVNNEAQLHLYKKEYDKAEAGFIKALDLRRSSLGINHPDYISTLRMLSSLYFIKEDWRKGIAVAINTEKLLQQNLLRNFSVLSENEKSKAIEDIIGFHEIMNIAAIEVPGNSMLIEHNLNSALLLKSLALASTSNVLNDVRNSSDREVQQLVKQWQDSKNFLGRQYSLPKDARITAVDSLEKKVEGLEKELTRRSAGFRKAREDINIDYRDVQKNMRPDEALIEFVRFAGFNIGEEKYAAYLLRKNDSVPTFIPLCFEKDLNQLFARSGTTTTALVSSLYRGAASEENITMSKGDSLYTLIWKPFGSYLKGIKTIAYSPAGKLYTIAFQALPVDSNKVLMDMYDLQQYTSTRLIAQRGQQNNLSKPKTAVLFGDAQFNMDTTLIKSIANKTAPATTSYVPANRGSSASAWNSLPGTAEEVKKLQQLFTNNGIATQIFTKQQSTEEALKGLNAKAPQVLHIATHGFFLPVSREQTAVTGNVYAMADNPLLQSGLVLAGANYVWGGRPPLQGVEDGIATAFEISQIDLSGTELVVLSACETALGVVQGSEGVFGLQRGFKMAGVKKMVVSLWQVPDKETAELMTLFYSTWLTGKTIEDAFQYAQSAMRKKYSPFYWAAFILVE
ncbi:MAG: Tetratricopeptide 1 repeat-containing protein [Chitinophagaceae bacterium]|nr:Tetratricopeptide 1 repeat-containing protein [Chitinophagaceae bacterium]